MADLWPSLFDHVSAGGNLAARWVYPAMRAHWSLGKSMCVMAVIVYLTHSRIWHSPINTVFVIGTHLICSYLRERFHSITPGVLVHSVYNGIVSLG